MTHHRILLSHISFKFYSSVYVLWFYVWSHCKIQTEVFLCSMSTCSRPPRFSPRTLTVFWVPRAAVERVVYHIESDVENKTSRSRRLVRWHGRIVCPSWEFPPRSLPSAPQAGCCPLQVLHPAGGWRWKQCQRWKWMKFPDAPPVFGLLTVQLRSLCGHLSPRFMVYCVVLTSCSHLFSSGLLVGFICM